MKTYNFFVWGFVLVLAMGCERAQNPMVSAPDTPTLQLPQSLQNVLETPDDIQAEIEHLASIRKEQLRAIASRPSAARPQQLRSSGVCRKISVPKDFPLLQQAVDNAQPGDTISVADGVYHEFVVVSTGGLTIMGEHPGRAQIEGGFLLYQASDVKISGFDIEKGGPDRAALEAVASFRSEFRNNTISRAFYGIYLFDSPESILQENNVHNNVIGIQLDLTNIALVKLNKVYENSLDGIQDLDSAIITYAENQCSGNGRAGLYIAKSEYWSTRKRDTVIGPNNRFNDNAVVGVALKKSRSNLLGAGNTASRNGLLGLLLASASEFNRIEKWTALDNGIYDCYNSTDNAGNVFKENTFGKCFNCNSLGSSLLAQKSRKARMK